MKFEDFEYRLQKLQRDLLLKGEPTLAFFTGELGEPRQLFAAALCCLEALRIDQCTTDRYRTICSRTGKLAVCEPEEPPAEGLIVLDARIKTLGPETVVYDCPGLAGYKVNTSFEFPFPFTGAAHALSAPAPPLLRVVNE